MILYNLGSNIFGETSYITKALDRGITAWCYNGLFHFPAEQL